MARYGFRGAVPETKILVLYALSCLTMPVTTDRLAEIVMIDEGVDYFHCCQALAEMVDSAHVLTNEESGQTYYSISPRGYEVSELMDNQLAFTLKMAIRQSSQMLERNVERDAFISTEAFTRGGVPSVCCVLTDGADPVLHIELMVTDQSTCGMIAKNFRRNADKIYEKLLKILTEEE
ncbi:MAG: DUF4364 family protein [Oscillospiraceae bacterium]|nr:DUF4364 family protein [Oscillospiraceae bacterium]